MVALERALIDQPAERVQEALKCAIILLDELELRTGSEALLAA